jgi:hypothetical protein
MDPVGRQTLGSYRTLRDGTLIPRFSRHFMPGYYHSVPPGQAQLRPMFTRLLDGGLGMLLRRFILGNSRLGFDNRCKVLPHYGANIL